jgi:NTE family protein
MVDFNMERVEDYDILTITVHEKPYAPVIAHFGGAYTLGYDGASSILLHLRINHREVNRLGAEWRTDMSLGQVTGIRSEFYQPLDYGRRWFVAGALQANYRIDTFYQGSYTLGQYRYTQAGGLLAGGFNIRRVGELAAGVEIVNHHTDARSGTLPVQPAAALAAGPVVRLRVDRLDDHRIPKTGFAAQARWNGPRRWLGSDDRWDRLWGNFLFARTFGNTTLLGKFQGGTDLDTDLPYYRDFFLGGLRNLSGYKFGQLRGRTFGAGSVGLVQRLGGGSLPFASRYFLGLWFDAGNVWAGTSEASLSDLRYCGAVSLILDSPLGPLEFGYGLAEAGNYAVHLNFGIHFATPAN